ncbi:unnamed protein product, partial [Mesorhabditis belari]|uniref:Cyanovirin-N domain-containing protein n=1 Tax=Mesorhabditis belari TaxID=2138241 RepID=A0AAF3EEF5_9BILA
MKLFFSILVLLSIIHVFEALKHRVPHRKVVPKRKNTVAKRGADDPICECTPPLSNPQPPYYTQNKPGLSDCVKQDWSFACDGSDSDVLEIALYDDHGNALLNWVYCAAWDYTWNGECATWNGGTFELNYPTYDGSLVAYHNCTNWGSDSTTWSYALSTCRDDGGEFISIHNAFENAVWASIQQYASFPVEDFLLGARVGQNDSG